jgi:hypothetical protein
LDLLPNKEQAMKSETTNDHAREHAITLYNELHNVKYAQTPDWAKSHRDAEIEAIMKALRIFAIGAKP